LKLSKEEVKHISQLARLGLDDDDIEKFQSQLSNILDNFEILEQVDTSDLPPTTQSIALQNVYRPDKARDSYTPEDILANAPQCENDFFKIKAVLED